MTKIQQRDVAQARLAVSLGMHDMAARALSAAIRAALRNRSELLAVAQELGLTTHPDFII